MEWWNNFVDWFNSSNGRYVVSSLVMPAIAIIVAGLLGAVIASGALRKLLSSREREQKVAAIAALVDASQQAAVWRTLTPAEQLHSDRTLSHADIQLRLLPLKGAQTVADWAAYSIIEIRQNAGSRGYDTGTVLATFRDGLLDWQNRPGRARKAFQADLDRWAERPAGQPTAHTESALGINDQAPRETRAAETNTIATGTIATGAVSGRTDDGGWGERSPFSDEELRQIAAAQAKPLTPVNYTADAPVDR